MTKISGRFIFLVFLIMTLFSFSGCSTDSDEREISRAKEFPVVETTITEIHQAIRTGTLTCRELVEIYLKRIEKYDQSTKLNAIVVVNPNALKRAEELDEEFKRTKKLSQHDQTAPQKDMPPGNSKMYFLENS